MLNYINVTCNYSAGFVYERNWNLTPLEDPYYIFQLSMMALAIAGVGLVGTNSYVTYLRSKLDDLQSTRIRLVKVLSFSLLVEYFSKYLIHNYIYRKGFVET